MTKFENINNKIRILRHHPELFSIKLENHIKNKTLINKLNCRGYINFKDLSSINNAKELHLRGYGALIDGLNDLLKKHNISTKKDQKQRKKIKHSYRLTNEKKIAKLGHGKKVFTDQQFDEIVKLQGFRNCKYANQSIDPDSPDEELFIKKLFKVGFKKIIKQIYLCNYVLKGKTSKYNPDIIALDKNGHIFVIEVKAYNRMVCREVMAKYRYVKTYCDKEGFIYLLTTKDFTTYEDLKKTHHNTHLEKIIKDSIKLRNKFTINDLNKLYKFEVNKSHKYIDKELVKICAANNYLMKGDMIYNRKILCIKPR